ncbi:cystathionine beta-lyase [Flexibacter flexilis DSM 6793]|uniref:Cystathionine beta-lyase n=1 Tax=Flexibacter flexilis DSM 6793 TaxID=927664 RepID=A0A1I1GBY7_9BACT|nr:PLP-dependent aspartate aminotransferase family protein [Flexibacter flexilis]SFC07378.1 cystathionine beta-lyase [Flexibacter flexilis DSM 6793]
MSRQTEILHSIPVDELTGSISVPVYQTSTFVQSEPGVHKGYDYARSNNPTRKVLEDVIANLEKGHSGYAFATGLAAIDAVVKLLSAGDEIIAVDDIYGGAYRLFTHVYQKFGIKVHYVDTTDAENILPYLNENTKFIWLESPTNPTLKVSDIATICSYAKRVGALVVVDNTFASPVAQLPFELGADIVIHSATKYIGGHSDLVAGLVVVKDAALGERVKFTQNSTGGILGPWDSFLVIRGIETIELRVREQSANALKVARFLESCPQVDKLYYPGLEQHKNHEIAKAQQNNLFGGVISFSLKNDTIEAAKKVVSSTQYFKLAESLGGVKSLVCQPALMTHASIPREKRLLSGVQDSLIRLSVGIESPEDLIDDLRQALSQIPVLEAAELQNI